MKAVWSFWSTPYQAYYHRYWLSQKCHLLSWILSISEASRHYPDTYLFTDSAGARILIDGIGIPFQHVDLRFDKLNKTSVDNKWWVLGKLTTYAAQTTPFLHLDNDVFLWKSLPAAVTDASLFAQNPESFRLEDQSLYRLRQFLDSIRKFKGWLPREWWWYAKRQRYQALCCGIFGGHDLGFIRNYANCAIKTISHPRNWPVWQAIGVRDNILLEQYFLAACLEYHQHHRQLGRELKATYLFPTSVDAFNSEYATRVGYTHLIGDAKNDRSIALRLENRVRRDYPSLYDRCRVYLDRISAPAEVS